MRQGSSPGRGEERQGGRPGEGTVSESPSRRCRVRAVFFDLYGTLATFDPPREVIQANAAAQFGLDLTPAGVDRGYHLADQFMSRQNAVAPVRHMSPAEQAEFFAKFEQLVLEGAGHVVDLDTAAAVWKKVRTQRYDLALFEDVIPSLGRIRDSGLVTGLISNVNSSGAALADSMGLTGHIDLPLRRATPVRKSLIPPYSAPRYPVPVWGLNRPFTWGTRSSPTSTAQWPPG